MPPSPRLQEQVTFWRDPALQDLEVLQARYITHAFGRHSHDGYAIGVIESGVEAFTYRGTVYQAPAGSLAIIHPGEVHTGQAGEPSGWAYRMLYPSVALLQQAAGKLGQEAGTEPFFPEPVVYDPELASRFRQLHLVLQSSPCRLERESRFLWVMAQLVERHSELRVLPLPSPLPADTLRVRQIQTYLQDHASENVSLEQLAQIVNLKPLRLLRLFRQETGLPPHAYLIQLRVSQAKRLLSEGLPIVAVALETGFADQSHLHRHFKRLVGVTPGQYAQGAGLWNRHAFNSCQPAHL